MDKRRVSVRGSQYDTNSEQDQKRPKGGLGSTVLHEYTVVHERQMKAAPVQGKRWHDAVVPMLQEVLKAFCVYCILHLLHSASIAFCIHAARPAHQQHHAKPVLSHCCHFP